MDGLTTFQTILAINDVLCWNQGGEWIGRNHIVATRDRRAVSNYAAEEEDIQWLLSYLPKGREESGGRHRFLLYLRAAKKSTIKRCGLEVFSGVLLKYTAREATHHPAPWDLLQAFKL